MLVVVGLLLALAPQERASGNAAAPPPARYELGPNNWPVPVAPARDGSVLKRPVVEPGGLGARGTQDAAAPHPLGEHPLRSVFAAVGAPGDVAALGVIRQRMQLAVLDHRGGTIAELSLTHEADLAAPARDRLVLDGDRLFGRDGAHAFAVFRGLAFPAMEAEAADELGWYGLVLRAPWVFADGRAFTVLPREELLREGRPMSRFRIEARPTAADLVGPAAPATDVDRYELWCDPSTNEPRLLVILPAREGARPCQVRLSEYAAQGNVRWPTKRTVEGLDGARRLEYSVVEAAVNLQVSGRHFAPPPR